MIHHLYFLFKKIKQWKILKNERVNIDRVTVFES